MDEWNKPIQHSDSILMLEFHAFEGVRHLLLHQYFKMQKRGNKFFYSCEWLLMLFTLLTISPFASVDNYLGNHLSFNSLI